MKKCNCIWILAPITRAVDDKTARGMHIFGLYWITDLDYNKIDLLGDAFKVQLLSKCSLIDIFTALTRARSG